MDGQTDCSQEQKHATQGSQRLKRYATPRVYESMYMITRSLNVCISSTDPGERQASTAIRLLQYVKAGSVGESTIRLLKMIPAYERIPPSPSQPTDRLTHVYEA